MMTYIESFTSGWHIQDRRHADRADLRAYAYCFRMFTPRNTWTGRFDGAVCAACKAASQSGHADA